MRISSPKSIIRQWVQKALLIGAGDEYFLYKKLNLHHQLSTKPKAKLG